MPSSRAAADRFAAPFGRLRRRTPRSWTRPLGDEELPVAPERLWGQDAALQEIDALTHRARPDRPAHLSVVVPASVGWPALVAEVLVERTDGRMPVVVVERPSRLGLRGRVGQPGLLAAAHGGYVVVDAERAAGDAAVWAALWECASLGSVEPLPVDDKGAVAQSPDAALASVVLVATEGAMAKLREKDRRIAGHFARRATVEPDLPASQWTGRLLSERLRRGMRRAGLVEPADAALAWLLEEADAWSRPGRIAAGTVWAEDLLLEAAAGARGPVTRRAVQSAALRADERSAGREKAHRDRLRRGRLRAQTEGEAVGVVNALMVYGKGVRSYAVPGRISAQVAVGRQGLVNIEREAKLSGRTYDKGVLMLGGLIQSLFAQESPLSLVATVAFEQSYGSVDGDSATLAEALALLSALSGVPCRQGIAATGGLSQRGELLSVGSLRVKVAGWWRTCRELGHAPGQGVVLPVANIEDLQLPAAILRDVRAGRFHLWAVERIEEAVEVVLGRPAGIRPGVDGFAKGSVYALADARLRAMARRLYPPRGTAKKTDRPSAPPGGGMGAAAGKESPE